MDEETSTNEGEMLGLEETLSLLRVCRDYLEKLHDEKERLSKLPGTTAFEKLRLVKLEIGSVTRGVTWLWRNTHGKV